MSRMNNTSRSLRIISQQNGWDPLKIEAAQGKDGSDLQDIYHPREDILSSDTWPIPGCMADRQANQSAGDNARWNKPDVGREAPNHTTGANPFPAMPGATSTRKK